MNYIIRFAIGLLTLLFLSCTNSKNNATSQPKNDSIKKYLELASNDTIAFHQRDLDNKKAFSFLDLSKNDTLTRWYLNSISFNYLVTRNWEDFTNNSKIHLKKSLEKKDTLNLARYYRYKGWFFSLTNNVDSAYYYYFKAEKFYRKTEDLLGLGIVVANRGNLQFDINDYSNAQLTFTKSINILKHTNSFKYLIKSEVSLADTYAEMGEPKKAIKLYKSILNDIEKAKFKGIPKIKAGLLNNLANTYGQIKLFNKERFYYEFALKDKNLIFESPFTYSLLIINLADNKIKQNNFYNVKNSLLNILNKENEINDKSISFKSRLVLSRYYQKINRINESKKYAEEALKIAKLSKVPYDILNGLVQLGYSDKDKAQKCLFEYDKKIDSLINEERKTRNQFYKIQLDVDQITEEKDTAVKQKWVIATMMSGLLLIAILLFVIFRQQSKQKEAKLLQDQQKANEETYQLLLNQQAVQEEAKTVEKKRIALELHDNILNKLAGIRFNLYSISHKNDPETIQKALGHVDRMKDVEDEIRAITHDFSNEMFAEGHSFRILLEKIIEEQNKLYPETKYRLELEEGINWDTISSKIKMNLYRIIQEGLYNIHKHAKASKAVVAIIQDENKICMAISDNGVGFDKVKIKEGIGIKNIKLRVSQLSGKISINSCDKNGTAINLAVPIVTINPHNP